MVQICEHRPDSEKWATFDRPTMLATTCTVAGETPRSHPQKFQVLDLVTLESRDITVETLKECKQVDVVSDAWKAWEESGRSTNLFFLGNAAISLDEPSQYPKSAISQLGVNFLVGHIESPAGGQKGTLPVWKTLQVHSPGLSCWTSGKVKRVGSSGRWRQAASCFSGRLRSENSSRLGTGTIVAQFSPGKLCR